MPRSELRWLLLLFAIPFVILVSIPIRHAAQNRQTTLLVYIVQADKNTLSFSDGTDGKIFEARRALTRGADPNALIDGKTPLIRYAAKKVELKMVELLQQNGAEVDYETQNLIEKARDIKRIDDLCRAISFGDVAAFNRQIGAINDINVYNREGKTLLQVAIENNGGLGTGIPITLIEKGANVRRKTAVKNGIDMVSLALLKGADLKLISALQKAGAPTSPASELAIAILHHDKRAVQRCLKTGVNIEAKASPQDWTPLQWAACEGAASIVDLLLKNGANPLATDASRIDGVNRNAREIALKHQSDYNTPKNYKRTIALLTSAEKEWRNRSLTIRKHVAQ